MNIFTGEIMAITTANLLQELKANHAVENFAIYSCLGYVSIEKPQLLRVLVTLQREVEVQLVGNCLFIDKVGAA